MNDWAWKDKVYRLLADLSLHIHTQHSIQEEIAERGMDWYLKSRCYKSPEHFMSVCAVASSQESERIDKFLKDESVKITRDHEGTVYLSER